MLLGEGGNNEGVISEHEVDDGVGARASPLTWLVVDDERGVSDPISQGGPAGSWVSPTCRRRMPHRMAGIEVTNNDERKVRVSIRVGGDDAGNLVDVVAVSGAGGWDIDGGEEERVTEGRTHNGEKDGGRGGDRRGGR